MFVPAHPVGDRPQAFARTFAKGVLIVGPHSPFMAECGAVDAQPPGHSAPSVCVPASSLAVSVSIVRKSSAGRSPLSRAGAKCSLPIVHQPA